MADISGWRQAITWTNADLLIIESLGTNLSEILIKMQNFSFMKMYLKITSAKWRTFCPGEDELMPERSNSIADVPEWRLSGSVLSFTQVVSAPCQGILRSMSASWCHQTTTESFWVVYINTLRLRQNGCHFADNIFKYIFLNENVCISIKISRKFVPKGSINNIPALVLIMAWRRLGDMPLAEPMMASLLMHIYISIGLYESTHRLVKNGSHFRNRNFI